MVVPHVGTWIEIELGFGDGSVLLVVPHVGTWIEIAIRAPPETNNSRASRRHVD